jgi:hypothetical protein
MIELLNGASWKMGSGRVAPVPAPIPDHDEGAPGPSHLGTGETADRDRQEETRVSRFAAVTAGQQYPFLNLALMGAERPRSRPGNQGALKPDHRRSERQLPARKRNPAPFRSLLVDTIPSPGSSTDGSQRASGPGQLHECFGLRS